MSEEKQVPKIEGRSSRNWAPYGSLGVFAIFIIVGSWFIYHPNPLLAAISFGIVGGIAHEIAQSGGRVVMPTATTGGSIQLGTIVGAALGVVAGILSLHGVTFESQTPDTMINVVVTALTAGVGLKGLADVDPTK
jgi:hypothetical protein